VLARSGALTAGAVAAVETAAGEGAWSRHARLALRYAPGSAGERPASLFLKQVTGFGRSEVEYYTRDYAGLAGAPLLRCHDAEWADGGYHLLLDDVSATHANGFDLEWTDAHCDAVADGLAALHAHRWDEPAPPAALDAYLGHIARGLEPLLALAGLDPAREVLLVETLERAPAVMRARLAGACLVHGDVNPGNVLLPRAGAGPVYLIDRQPFEWSLTRWLGVSDLAYLMCAFWPAEQRRARERRMLSRYHAGLLALGVRGYDFDALWDDYRLCAVQTAHVAIEWCVLADDRERMRWLWSAQLERAFAAMDDLDSPALWRA